MSTARTCHRHGPTGAGRCPICGRLTAEALPLPLEDLGPFYQRALAALRAGSRAPGLSRIRRIAIARGDFDPDDPQLALGLDP